MVHVLWCDVLFPIHSGIIMVSDRKKYKLCANRNILKYEMEYKIISNLHKWWNISQVKPIFLGKSSNISSLIFHKENWKSCKTYISRQWMIGTEFYTFNTCSGISFPGKAATPIMKSFVIKGRRTKDRSVDAFLSKGSLSKWTGIITTGI